ncbi:MAG: hypothetical protein HOC71_11415 [Candidatus Latescibacteria bacterium]|jgi:muconate cycloisomerase|nr:hypothetical protein [Candidatus Latescibacterota bacterium]
MDYLSEPGSEDRRTFLKQITGGMIGLSAGLGLPASSYAQKKHAESAKLAITRIEKFKVQIPAKTGMVNTPEYAPDGLSTFWEGHKCILKLHGDNGFIGIGETSRNYSEEAVDANIRFLTGKDIFSLNFAHPSLELPQRRVSSAFEMAIFDLIGKTWGVPVYKLLGGKCQEKAAVTYWTGRRNGQNMEKVARKAVDMGYKGIKFKWRPDDPILDELRALDKVAPELEIIVDLNRYYKEPEEFLKLARQFKGFNIRCIEDPVPHDMDLYTSFREKLDTPIAMTLGDPKQVIEAIKAGACDCFNFGGDMRNFVRICNVADAAGMQAWHGSGIEVGIQDAAYLHAITATRNCTIPSDVLGYLIREDDLLAKTFTVKDGFATLPDAPGLGVELDEDALKKYSV